MTPLRSLTEDQLLRRCLRYLTFTTRILDGKARPLAEAQDRIAIAKLAQERQQAAQSELARRVRQR